MKKTFFALFFSLFCASASAQSVPGPTATAWLDSIAKPTCEGGSAQPYDMTYSAACFLPSGVVAGSPWMTAVRVTITPTSGPVVVKTIPRAYLIRVTNAATCAPNAAPCLQVPLGIVPVGDNTARITFLDGQNLPGPDSPVVSFTPARPSLPAPEGSTIR